MLPGQPQGSHPLTVLEGEDLRGSDWMLRTSNLFTLNIRLHRNRVTKEGDCYFWTRNWDFLSLTVNGNDDGGGIVLCRTVGRSV